jgi:uncharacterized membrane protein SpoIIM required for sporulation
MTRMDETRFADDSRAVWERLAADVGAVRAQGVRALGADELRVMHDDYRRTASDLAYAQTHYPGSAVTSYLNELVAAAHAELYGSSPRRFKPAIEFLTVGYPRLVRAHARPIMLAAAILLGAVALGYLLAYVDYPLARVFLPAELRDGVADRFESGGASRELASSLAPLMSAGITANNIQVALVAFAGGMTFGVLTAWALFNNGLVVGALAGVFAKASLSLPFWSLIVPHGALEIPAIILAGGAGLVLARALWRPGDVNRLDALRAASGPAIRLVLGTIPLFVVAGLIEGFVTPRAFPPLLKVGFGVLVFVLFVFWLAFAGRETPDA